MNSSSARELSALDDPEYEWADEEADCPVGALAESAPASTAANRARSSMDDPDREWQEADCFSDDQLGAQVLEAPWGRPAVRRASRAARTDCGEYCKTCKKSCVKFAGAKPGLAFKTGERGVGYYPDSGGCVPNAKDSEPRGLGGGSGGRALLLDALVPQVAGSSPPSKKSRSKHGPRGSKPKFAEIVTFNSSGEPQLRNALRQFQPKKDEEGAEHQEVAAICCQEHHATGDKWTDLQHAARKLNWAMQGAPAVHGRGHSGCSGASIAAKRHIGLAPPADLSTSRR